MRDMIGNEAINVPDENEQEVWVGLKQWPNYEVSSFGRIRNINSGRELKPKLDKNGYYVVVLYKTINKQSFKKDQRLSRLICEAFWGEPTDDKNITDHIDRCRINNYYKNLRWVNHSESQYNRSHRKHNSNFSWADKKTPILRLDRSTGAVLERFECPQDVIKKYNLGYTQLMAHLNNSRCAFQIGKFVREEDFYQEKI